MAGETCRLVKLHRPPPEMRTFEPVRGPWSSTSTDRPRRAHSMAQNRPEAPAPMMMTFFVVCEVTTDPEACGKETVVRQCLRTVRPNRGGSYFFLWQRLQSAFVFVLKARLPLWQ